MPSTDELLQSELWRGAVPCEIRLARDEVAEMSPPPPLYALVPRGAFLPLWHARDGRCATHFARSLPPGVDAATATPWFDHEGTPLRWGMTAGVLRDVTCGASDETHGTLPWKLTIHYRAYGGRGGGGGGGGGGEDAKENDADGLIRCDDEESVRARFFNDLKEAVCVARGSAAAVMSMTRAAQADLWRSVVDGERRLAWRAEEELGSRRGGAESSSGGGSGKRSDARRRVPVRFYLLAGDARREVKCLGEVKIVSAPVFVVMREEEAEDPGGERERERTTTTTRTSTVRSALAGLGVLAPTRAVCQGVALELDTELERAHATLKGSDHLLHVVVWCEA